MTSENLPKPESTPNYAYEFAALYSILRSRLADAVKMQADNPQFRFFTYNHDPESGQLYATFTLVESVSEYRHGKAKHFDVGFDVEVADLHVPKVIEKDEPDFYISYSQNGIEALHQLGQQGYIELQSQVGDSPLEGILEKAFVYRPVPVAENSSY